MAMETLANVFLLVYAVHSLFPSDSHDEIVPTKMQSRVANGTHPFEEEEEEEEEEVQTSVKCEVKFSKLGKGFKKKIILIF